MARPTRSLLVVAIALTATGGQALGQHSPAVRGRIGALAKTVRAVRGRIGALTKTVRAAPRVRALVSSGQHRPALRVAQHALRGGAQLLPGRRFNLQRLSDTALLGLARDAHVAAENTLHLFRGLQAGKDQQRYGGVVFFRRRDKSAYVHVLQQAYQTMLLLKDVARAKPHSTKVAGEINRLRLHEYDANLRGKIKSFRDTLSLNGFSLLPRPPGPLRIQPLRTQNVEFRRELGPTHLDSPR